MKQTLTLSIIAFLLLVTTDIFAVISHPISPQKELSKKEKKQLKRQQKVIGFLEKKWTKQMDRFIARHQLFADSTKCDTIVLRNGKELIANINKISNEGISYRRCNQSDTPEIVLSSAAVREIIYANGARNKIEDLVFDITKASNNSTEKERDQGNFVLDSTRCDTIVLRNGNKIIANILQMLPKEIEYRRCHRDKSTSVFLSKRAIKELRYVNGPVDSFDTSDYIASPRPQNAAILDSELKRAQKTGLLVGVLSGLLTGWIIGLLAILILFLVYQNKSIEVRKRAMKYAWRGWGIVMAILLAIILIAIILTT